MKTCPTCASVAFDDMELCYDCMSYYEGPTCRPPGNTAQGVSTEQEAAHLQVALAGYFSYELLLLKRSGHSLSVGSASENAVVIPQEQVAPRQLEVFYEGGCLWAKSLDGQGSATVGESPLSGTMCVEPGTEIMVGDARITLL